MTHMIHNYKVQGVHCENCAEKIESAALKIPGVISAKFNDANMDLQVEMSKHISIDTFNKEIQRLGDYKLTDEKMIVPKSKYDIRSFTPLIVIFLLIACFVFAMRFFAGSWGAFEAMHDFMGAFFIIFGAFKVINLRGFADAYSTYDLLAKRSRLYSYGYPFIELSLGALYLARYGVEILNWIVLPLMLFNALGVYLELRKGEKIPCACLGVVFKIPMTYVTLAEDLIMAGMAFASIIL